MPRSPFALGNPRIETVKVWDSGMVSHSRFPTFKRLNLQQKFWPLDSWMMIKLYWIVRYCQILSDMVRSMQMPQDLISSKSKGGIGAPWAEDRDRPIAGIDIAEKGLETKCGRCESQSWCFSHFSHFSHLSHFSHINNCSWVLVHYPNTAHWVMWNQTVGVSQVAPTLPIPCWWITGLDQWEIQCVSNVTLPSLRSTLCGLVPRRKHARCPNSPGVMFDQTRVRAPGKCRDQWAAFLDVIVKHLLFTNSHTNSHTRLTPTNTH